MRRRNGELPSKHAGPSRRPGQLAARDRRSRPRRPRRHRHEQLRQRRIPTTRFPCTSARRQGFRPVDELPGRRDRDCGPRHRTLNGDKPTRRGGIDVTRPLTGTVEHLRDERERHDARVGDSVQPWPSQQLQPDRAGRLHRRVAALDAIVADNGTRFAHDCCTGDGTGADSPRQPRANSTRSRAPGASRQETSTAEAEPRSGGQPATTTQNVQVLYGAQGDGELQVPVASYALSDLRRDDR